MSALLLSHVSNATAVIFCHSHIYLPPPTLSHVSSSADYATIFFCLCPSYLLMFPFPSSYQVYHDVIVVPHLWCHRMCHCPPSPSHISTTISIYHYLSRFYCGTCLHFLWCLPLWLNIPHAPSIDWLFDFKYATSICTGSPSSCLSI